jgi:hypothetical protein
VISRVLSNPLTCPPVLCLAQTTRWLEHFTLLSYDFHLHAFRLRASVYINHLVVTMPKEVFECATVTRELVFRCEREREREREREWK